MSPWANYTFRVRARNKIGPSEPSGPSQHCATPETVPKKNPDKVMGRGTEPDNLVISWTVCTFLFKFYVKSIIALIYNLNQNEKKN